MVKKYNLANNKCVNSCDEDINNNYEYENICYGSNEDIECSQYYNYDKTECLEEIPEGYYLKNPYNKTIDKCDIKC